MSFAMSERRTSLIGGMMIAAGPLSIAMYAPALPTVVADLGTSDAMGKLSLAIYFGAFALAQLLCGPLSDGLGRRKVAIGFFVLYLSGGLIAAIGPNVGWLLAGRLLQGIGVAAGVAVSRAIVRDQFVGTQSIRTLTLMNLILTVAPAIAPTIGSLILQVGTWHTIFFVMAAYGALAAMAMAFFLSETLPPERRTPLRPGVVLANYRHLAASPAFMRPALVQATAMGGFYVFTVLLPFILIDRIGLSPLQFAIAMLAQTGSYIAGTLVTRQALKRFDAETLMRIGVGFTCVAGLGFLLVPQLFAITPASMLAPVMVWTFGIAFIGPGSTSSAMAGFGGMAGSAAALFGCIQMGWGFLGSLVAGLFADTVLSLSVLAPVMALLAALLLLLKTPAPPAPLAGVDEAVVAGPKA